MAEAEAAVAALVSKQRDTGARSGALGRFVRNPAGVVATLFLLALIVACLLAPVIDPYNPLAQNLEAVLKGPSGAHILGTDQLGRDVASRLLSGGTSTLVGVGEILLTALLLGVPAGLYVGYVQGIPDAICSRLADLLLALPSLVILLLIFAIEPRGETVAMIALGVLLSPGLFRVARAVSMQAAEELYVRAAEVSGMSRWKVIVGHILPRVAGPVVVNTSVIAAFGLILQTGLEFLQLGVQPPAPSWGGLVADGQSVIAEQSWLLVPPSVLIGLVILAFVTIGDALRDAVARPDGGAAAGPASGRRAGAGQGSDRGAAGSQQAQASTGPSGPADPDALLEVSGLSIGLVRPGQPAVPLVTNVSFSVRAGEAIAVVGESGCGKSVSALSVLGLLPDGLQVQGGTCRFEGADLFALSDRAMRRIRGRRIGFVSQDPMVSLDPCYTVGNQLTEVIRLHHGLSRAQAKARAHELLTDVRLHDPASVMRRYPHELSGGMAQRVTLALALAGDPALLIADEPTTALDVTVQAGILKLMADIRERTGLAIVFITHDFGIVSELCDRVVVLYAGEVVEQGPVDTVIGKPRHPYTSDLLSCDLEGHVPGMRLPTIAGTVVRPGEWPDGCRFSGRCRHAMAQCHGPDGRVLRHVGGTDVRCLLPQAQQDMHAQPAGPAGPAGRDGRR